MTGRPGARLNNSINERLAIFLFLNKEKSNRYNREWNTLLTARRRHYRVLSNRILNFLSKEKF